MRGESSQARWVGMRPSGGTRRKTTSHTAARRKAPARDVQKAATREAIRQAAWDLFTTVGYEATTTKAIAKRAGIGAGTVFVHASDKEDLLHLVMHDRLYETVEDALARLPDAPLVDQLLHLFGALFRMYAQHPGVAAAFVANLPRGAGPNGRRMSDLTIAFLHRIAHLVVEAQRRGEVAREIPPVAAAQNLFALYFMALLAWLQGHATLETALDPGLRGALQLQLNGLRPAR